MRTCLACGVPLSWARAHLCPGCRLLRGAHKREPRPCAGCGVLLQHSRAQRCRPCAYQHRLERARQQRLAQTEEDRKEIAAVARANYRRRRPLPECDVCGGECPSAATRTCDRCCTVKELRRRIASRKKAVRS